MFIHGAQKYKVMRIKIQKFKFNHRFESLETSDVNVAAKSLIDYRYCHGNLYMSTKFVGEYATCDFID